MKILAAPNSMKGSLSAPDFSEAIEKGFRKVSLLFNVRRLPIADGGDYSGLILCDALKAKRISVPVRGPLGNQIEAEIGIAGETAIIELASASGLRLLNPTEFNPMRATTFGTGQLIKRAIELGCTKILLGVGGSATIDGGIGLLDALGYTFYDKNGEELPGNPLSLDRISEIRSPSDNIPEIETIILCDVNNPLLGEFGAARVFGPQKGAGQEMISALEKGLRNWVDILERKSGREIRNLQGMGAAGGVASSLITFLNAKLVVGASAIFDILDLKKHIDWADLVITGEGKFDAQSMAMKAPVALASEVKKNDKPVIALAGSFDMGMEKVFDGIFPIVNGPLSLEQSMDNAKELVISASMQIAGLILRSNNELYKNHILCEAARKHLLKGEINDADVCLNSIDNQMAAYWFMKGMILQKEQKWGTALNCFLQTLEIDPGFEQAKTSIGIIRDILNFTNPSLLDP